MGTFGEIWFTNQFPMITTLPLQSSTLLVRLPDEIALQPFQDKTRIKKGIVRAIIRMLQTHLPELLYVGYKPDYVKQSIDTQPITENSTYVAIHVLDDNGATCSFATSQRMLQNRFKRELQSNRECIIIDNPCLRNGFVVRNIEIYVKSIYAGRVRQLPHYTLAISSSYMAAS